MFGFGEKLNLTSNDVADIRHQYIAVDDGNEPAPENIPYQVPHQVNSFN